MIDIVNSASRRRMMSGIRSKNTKPEIIVRKILFSLGYRFRLHQTDLPGSPDIVMRGRKIVIFVHGCFWHQHSECRMAKLPATNSDFWIKKLSRNVERDKMAVIALRESGWRVLTVWECSTKKKDKDRLELYLKKWLVGDSMQSDIPNF